MKQSFMIEQAASLSHLLERELIGSGKAPLELECLAAFSSELFNSRFEGIVITDSEARILRVNSAFMGITGYTEGEVLGENPRILKSDRHKARFYKDFWDSLVEEGVWEGEIWNRRKCGEVFPEWLRVRALSDTEGETVGYVSSFFDLTERKKLESELRKYALEDALTGLLNKDRFMDQLRLSMSAGSLEGKKSALVCLDVDRFKQVNESLGHICGDRLLQLLGKRLEDCLKAGDFLSRFGGDDFCFFLDGRSSAGEIIEAVKRFGEVFRWPFQLGEDAFFMSGTMGVAVFPEDGKDPESLLRKADIALYRAKQKRSGGYLFFSSELEESYADRLMIESELRRALLEDQLRVFYQPKIDLASGKVIGVEALVRWKHPERGLISPGEFIPVAEETGLIGQLDFRVLEMACRWSCRMEEVMGVVVPVAVNLSTRSLFAADLVEHISRVLDETGLAPDVLRLEITESALMEDVNRSFELFSRLREMGLELHLDDFGTGYSSLSYLRQFPLNCLKIDQSFTRDIPGEQRGVEIVRGIIGLGHALGLQVLAEGVEDAEQVRVLGELGCDQAQGFHYSRPLPCDEVESFLLRKAPDFTL